MSAPTDLTPYLAPDASAQRRDLSELAQHLIGSEILKVAAEIRSVVASGKQVLNLTIGDFSPKEFPIPTALQQEIVTALGEGHTNYPPADGVPELKEAIRGLYKRGLGLDYPTSTIVVQSGGRPGIYATYRALISPGDKVVYSLPSWNNNHYCHLSGATPVEIETAAEHGFLPTAATLAPHLSTARLLVLNTPVNPCGTVMREDALRDICTLILEENRRRRAAGTRALYVLFDQIYWMLTFGNARHVTPPQINPEMAEYTIFVDGISKWLAATGLRLGWTIAPPAIIGAIKDIVAHTGAWAPKPVQIATARILEQPNVLDDFVESMRGSVRQRLDALYQGFRALHADGFPVDCIPPEGAIYLSARVNLFGRTYKGTQITSNEMIRKLLLDEAGFAVVPFNAFGFRHDNGWFRLSVGAVSVKEIEEGLPRLRAALERTSS
jgi:aspartate aminotransferase